ncbi:MAG: protein kinase domain-containing protein [Myxococcota bacterium]
MSCPDDATLRAWFAGELPEARRADVAAHVAQCERCRARSSVTQRLASEPELTLVRAEPLSAPPALAPGDRVGPYVVGERAGAGGMGEVYAAYDPRLDRRVALKLMRADVVAALGTEAGRLRLVREAQALARLSHRNVVTVHDVGESGPNVYLAMELVAGQTLREHVAGAREWPRTLALLVQAGRGLSAAHAAGLVHRDFKPDNVLVTPDGRAVVVDFGLAVLEGAARVAALPAASSLGAPLTQGGEVLGTPAYMAPELFADGRADALSDQFAFAVTACEALWGRRPEDGALPEGGSLPPVIRRALARALSKRPSDRFPSLDELLEVFEATLRARERRWLTALVASTVLLVAGAGGAWGWWRSTVCAGAGAQADVAWSASTLERAREAFRAHGGARAVTELDEAAPVVSAWAARWRALRTQACEASRVRSERPESVLAVQQACFERQLLSLDALAETYAHPDDEVVMNAVYAAHQLPRLDECLDTAGLTRVPGPPADPTLRALQQEAEQETARAEVLFHTESRARARELARSAVDKASRSTHPPTLVRAWHALAWMESDAGETAKANELLQRAIALALSTHDDAEAALLANELTRALYTEANNPAEGATWLQLADALVTRLGPSGVRQQGQLELVRGIIDSSAARHAEAIAHLRAAEPLLVRAYGPRASILGDVQTVLGLEARALRDYPAARHALTLALELRRENYGERNPSVAAAQMNLALLLKDEERFAEAEQAFLRVLRSLEDSLGREHKQLARVLKNLASVAAAQGHHAEAVAYAERAISVLEKSLPGSVQLWFARYALAQVLLEQQPERALGLIRDFLVAMDQELAEEERVDVARREAAALLSLGRAAEALAVLERARSFLPKAQPADVGEFELLRARVSAVLHRPSERDAALERARALLPAPRIEAAVRALPQ